MTRQGSLGIAEKARVNWTMVGRLDDGSPRFARARRRLISSQNHYTIALLRTQGRRLDDETTAALAEDRDRFYTAVDAILAASAGSKATL